MKAAQSNGQSVTARSRVAAVGTRRRTSDHVCGGRGRTPDGRMGERGARTGGVWLPQHRGRRGVAVAMPTGVERGFHGCRTLHHGLPGRKQHKLIVSPFLWVGSRAESWIQGTGLMALPSRCQEAVAITRSSGLSLFHWVSPCSFRTDVPSAARSQRSLSAFRHWAPPAPASHRGPTSSDIPLRLSSATNRSNPSAFKGLV